MSFSVVVRRVLGRAATLPGPYALARRELRRRVNVVYLHYVGPPVPYYAEFFAGSTLEQLDKDLTFLGRHFAFSTLSEVTDGRGEGDVPRLAVTFDDGFDLAATGALEVLEQHAVKATTFVITATIDNAHLMWRNKLSAIRAQRDASRYLPAYNRLMREAGLPEVSSSRLLMPASQLWPMDTKDELADALWVASDMPPLAEFLEEFAPYFTWDGLREWRRRGHHVGFHTATHPYCSRLGEADIQVEIVEPAAALRKALALDFLAFSYPFGSRLTEGVERALFNDGVFDAAFGIEGFARRGTPPFRLERGCIEGELLYPVFGGTLCGRP